MALGASAGQVVIRLVTDPSGAIAGFHAAATSAKSFSAKMNAVGANLTRYATLPIAALGVASVAMSVDFDKSMTKIRALVGASDGQMKQYRATVLSLSKQTGRGPKELAEALYFVTSSGFEGASALRVLTASAKASAAGLGDTATIADAVTSAVNAYGEANLSASKATDILLAAVREGKNEPEELAGSIGRVIPVAEAMGVSFGEVAGTMAALSLNGTNAEEAVTQIVAGMSQSIKPTQQGAKALASLNMTYADLRKQIKDKGLIDTFNDLKTAFGGNVEQVAKVFGNIRALRGVMTLTGPAAAKYKDIIEAVGEAQGDTNRAFGIAAQSPAQKFAVAMAKLKVAAIQMGTALTPIALQIAGAVARMAEAFNGLGSGGQKAVLVFAGIAAAAGPLMRLAPIISGIVGAVAPMAGALGAAFSVGGLSGLGAAISAALGPVGLVVAAIAAIGTGLVIAYKKSETFRNIVQGVFHAVATAARWVWDQIKAGWDYLSRELGPAMRDLWSAIVPILRRVASLARMQFRLIATAVGVVVDYIRAHWDTIGPIVHEAWQIVTTVSKAAVRALAQVIRMVADILRGDWGAAWKHFVNIAKINAQTTAAVVRGMRTILVSLMKLAVKGMIAAIQALPGLMAAVGKAALIGLLNAVRAGVAMNIAMLKTLPGRVKAAFAGAGGWLVSAGAAILRGLLSGIQSMAGQVVNAAVSVASRVKDAIASALHIKSPSRVTYSQGVSVGMGLAMGIESTASDVARSATKVAIAVARAMSKALGGLKGKRAKSVAQAADVSGAIGTLVDFISAITEALNALNSTTVPQLAGDWKTKVQQIVKMAAQVSVVIAKEINKAFPWTKGTKKRDAQVGSKGKKVGRASEMTGPIAELVGFVVDMVEALKTFAGSEMPALSADWKTSAKQVAEQAIEMAKIASTAITDALTASDRAMLTDAAESAGPASTLVSFITDSMEALKTFATTAMPTLSADWQARAQVVAANVVALVKIVATELSNAFASAADWLENSSGLAESSQSIISLISDSIGVLQAMTEVDPRLFEPPANAFIRVGAIIVDMANSVSTALAGIVISDAVLVAADRVKQLAESLLSVLEVMRGIRDVDAGNFGTTGWSNIVSAAGGMVNAASGLPGVGGASYAGGGGMQNVTFTGPIYASTPEQAKQSAASFAREYALAVRRTGRG